MCAISHLIAILFFFSYGIHAAHQIHRLVPLLTLCGKSSGALTSPMVITSLSKLIYCVQIETDPSFVALLYKAIGNTLHVVGLHVLMPELMSGLMDGTKLQLQNMAEKWEYRSGASSGSEGVGGLLVPGSRGNGGANECPQQHLQVAQDEDNWDVIALMEEMEEFALEDMEKMLRMLDGQHPLLIAIVSMRDLVKQPKRQQRQLCSRELKSKW